MNDRRRAGAHLGAAVLGCAALWVLSVNLAADGPGWKVGTASVRIVCPMTVGGSFEAKTTALAGAVALVAPGMPLAGELAVDLRTLDTGIELRNSHLRTKYLEVDKGAGFDRAVMSNIVLGDKDPATFKGRTGFSGTLLLHGVTRSINGEATIQQSADSVRIEASFPVELSDFGIELPQYLGVGVRNRVQALVNFVATKVAAGSAGHE